MHEPLINFERFPAVIVYEDGLPIRLESGQWASRASAMAEHFASELSGAANVALIGRTSTNLLLAWLGLVLAGKTPCLLQYPTAKMTREFWQSSVRAAIEGCGLDAAVTDSTVAEPDSLGLDTVLRLPADLPPARSIQPLPKAGSIIQLSSGTTGVRKGIRFSLDEMALHARTLAGHLGYGHGEIMVSWLPLYHDMGFVTSWILPLALGVGTVLMDPMDWVRQPGAFFDMVAAVGGTRAYQPNFALEVLARHYAGQDISSLREVVSCSEPTRSSSLAAFSKATGLPPAKLSNCYAMAENVFGVSHAANPRTVSLEGRDYVSCGAPVQGVSIKQIDGELWVKSPVSMTTYLGGTRIAGPDGFYPTGDMGFLVDGEVVVTGRKRDIVIAGGEKHMLSDVDHAVALQAPWSKGRACSLAEDMDNLGTQGVRVLVEHNRFWEIKEQETELARMISGRTGLARLGLSFVPQGFITKTSSGKVNRPVTYSHWKLAMSGPEGTRADRLEAEALLREFPALATDGLLGDVLDSLGYLSLTLRLAEHGVSCEHTQSTASLLSRLERPEREAEVLLILSLSCAQEDRFLSSEYLDELSRELGVFVHYERLITPRSGVLLNDLIFHDWFMPRLDNTPAGPFRSAVRTLRRAGIIITGDTPELRHPRFNTYPALARDFRRDPGADRLAMRWPGYFRNHHLLPVSLVPPSRFEQASVNADLEGVSSYLNTPLFRMAFSREFEDVTRAWEYRDLHDPGPAYDRFYKDPHPDHGPLREAFKRHLLSLPSLKLTTGESRNRFQRNGASHYCGWQIDPELERRAKLSCAPHGRIVFTGPESSLPGLARDLAGEGKEVSHTHWDDQTLSGSCDFFIQAGYGESLSKGREGMLLMDHPVSRLYRYANSPFPFPPDQLAEFLNSKADRDDAALAQRHLDAHLTGSPRLVAARNVPANRVIYMSDMDQGAPGTGIPAWMAEVLSARVVYTDKQEGEPFLLTDFFPA